MSPLGRLIKIWALGRALSLSTPYIYRILWGLAAIVMLMFVTAVLVGACIFGALDFSYHELVLRGFTRYQSLGIVGGLTLLLIASAFAWVRRWWNHVHGVTRELIRIQTPWSWRAARIVNAFIQGVFGHKN